MEVVYRCCCGIDVRKSLTIACLRTGGKQELRELTRYRDLGADYFGTFHREHKIRSYLKRLQALGWQPDIAPATA